MRIPVLIAAITVAPIMAGSAVAEEAPGQSQSIKRQIVVCMTKSMTANRTLSYNAAERECKDSVTARNQAVATGKRALTADATVAPAFKTP